MTIRFTLRQLTFFAETARSGGIAPAARQLNVSAAAIASGIDKLEAITGLTLFDRFPAQGMRLTREGTAFMAEAEALLTRAEALGKSAADLANGATGSIHIGTHFAIAQKIVLPAVLAFRESHPSIRIEVFEDDYPSLVGALDAGDVDALVVFDQGFDSGRHAVETLVALPPLVLLSASHPLAGSASVELEHLAAIPYIAVSRAGPGPSYLSMLQAAGLQPEVPFSSQSRELVQAYVGKGLGYTLVGFPPEKNVTVEGDAVIARPLSKDIGHFNVVIARSCDVTGRHLVDAFLDACRIQTSKL